MSGGGGKSSGVVVASRGVGGGAGGAVVALASTGVFGCALTVVGCTKRGVATVTGGVAGGDAGAAPGGVAADDPVIPVSDTESLPDNPCLEVLVTEHGGHCGYLKNWKLDSWAEDFIADRFVNGVELEVHVGESAA